MLFDNIIIDRCTGKYLLMAMCAVTVPLTCTCCSQQLVTLSVYNSRRTSSDPIPVCRGTPARWAITPVSLLSVFAANFTRLPAILYVHVHVCVLCMYSVCRCTHLHVWLVFAWSTLPVLVLNSLVYSLCIFITIFTRGYYDRVRIAVASVKLCHLALHRLSFMTGTFKTIFATCTKFIIISYACFLG